MKLTNVWKIAAMCCVVALVALTAAPRVASASNRTHVWYDHSGAPAGYSRDDMHTMISLAIREWEQHSDGQIVWRFMGDVSPGERIAGPSSMTIVWDAGLGSGTCAQAWGFCPSAPFTCTISLNPAFFSSFGARTRPDLGVATPCGLTPYASIHHEIAHNVYPTALHFNDSVLGTPTIANMAGRHVWNRDMTSVGGSVNPASAVLIDYDEINSAGSVITSIAGTTGTLSGEYGNFVSSLGLGPAGHAYSRASALSRSSATPIGVFFERNTSGDLRTWSGRRMIPGGSTRHHTCVVSDTAGTNLYVMFTDANEIPPLAANEGARGVMFSESHDGGNSWTTAASFGGITRSGVSCSFDASTNRVLVAVSGTDERLWINSRVASAVGAAGWAGWGQIDSNEAIGSPTTAYSPFQPHVSFDPFAPGVAGVMSWFDWQTFSHRIERLTFNASLGRYFFAVPPGTTHSRATFSDAESSVVRGPVIPNQIDVQSSWALSVGELWCPSGGCPRSGRTEAALRLRYRNPAATSTLAMPWNTAVVTFSPAPVQSDFQSFGDAAPHRFTVRNAYLRFILRDSF